MLKRSILPLVLLALIWHILSLMKIIDPTFFPSPIDVLKNLWALTIKKDLMVNVLFSLQRLGIAVVLTIPVAIALGMIVIHFKFVDRLLNPIIAFTYPLPKVALIPLLLLILGVDNASKIALISIGMFYLVFINFRAGLQRLLNGHTYDIVRVYPMKKIDYFWHYLIKGAQLELLTGLKLAINYGLTLVVVSELTTSNNGIGYFVWRSWDQFNILNVYSGIYVLSILGFIFYYFFEYLIHLSRDKFF